MENQKSVEGVCSAAAATTWPHARAGTQKTTGFLATIQPHERDKTRPIHRQLCRGMGWCCVCAPEMFQAGTTTVSHKVKTGVNRTD